MQKDTHGRGLPWRGKKRRIRLFFFGGGKGGGEHSRKAGSDGNMVGGLFLKWRRCEPRGAPKGWRDLLISLKKNNGK